MNNPEPQNVAGIDGWRGGWVVAMISGDAQPRVTSLAVVTSIAEAIEVAGSATVIGIDMPIGLPTDGLRASDVELKAHLGPAGRSLFWTPTRAAIDCDTHAAAVAINKSLGGKGPSAQGWGLANRIREVRQHLLSTGDSRVIEVHPESSFRTMAQLATAAQPAELTETLSLASKKSARGLGQRIALVQDRCRFDVNLLAEVKAGPVADDCLDAIAAAWTALRVASGEATWFGPRRRDDQGFLLGVPT